MIRALSPAMLLLVVASVLSASERQVLSEGNYDKLAPKGKEVDAIYGDFVLSNSHVIAVVAAPGENRDANLTVRNVGGALIDLTTRKQQSDQLSCLYPGGGRYKFTRQMEWPKNFGDPPQGAATIALEGYAMQAGSDADSPERIQVGYQLNPGENFLRVVSTITNQGPTTLEVQLRDGVRADGEFKFGHDSDLGLAWAQDEFWRQAYGILPESKGLSILVSQAGRRRNPRELVYRLDDQEGETVKLASGKSVSWTRVAIPAANTLAVWQAARDRLSVASKPIRLVAKDKFGPVAGARVEVVASKGGANSFGVGHTNDQGILATSLPPGQYQVNFSAQGHKDASSDVSLLAARQDETTIELTLSEPAFVQAEITNGQGKPIPAKVQLTGQGDTPSPSYGPDSAVRGVRNLQYTPDGRFRAKLLPGRYRWIASYGPEHDAAEGEFTVAPGGTAVIKASLPRTVDTTGWISSELHSHSSPSGDNTASQRGRVLNLLADHLEFCPCTEHQRIDVYDEHLAYFNAAHRMLTCPGMELTGQPLPLNHQNAFPLKHHPHAQHGGGPLVHPDPVKQIKRLATWDNDSEKVVQTNHPNVAQMVGDRDLDGKADAGFEKMFGYMDAMEIHPPELIFQPLGAPGEPDNGVGSGGWDGRGNPIVNWMQLLNQGYRVTGVVNTDAHYNHHGSGWLRNWVRCSTDDPAKAKVSELIHEFEHGHVVVSNGPYLQVNASTANGKSVLPGDDLLAPQGKVTLHIQVQCPNWLDVNRVQVFVNGRPSPELNYTARTHQDLFARGAKVFDQKIEVALNRDAHLIVAVCGEGRQLGKIYGKSAGATMPVAVSNPVFVDLDGDANSDGIRFEWNHDGLGAPLPKLDDVKPSHGHDHANHTH